MAIWDRHFAWHNDFRHAENKFAEADDQLEYDMERKQTCQLVLKSVLMQNNYMIIITYIVS